MAEKKNPVYEYIGPDYKIGIIINGRQMKPRDFPQEQLPALFNRFSELKQYFREKTDKPPAGN